MEKENLKLSVIIPVYNVMTTLTRAVTSVLNQDLSVPYEIILVNDGSSDDSGKLAEKLVEEHKNIKVYHKKNGGLASARNYGLKYAEGTLIAFLDSDDLWDSRKLEIQIEYMLKENVGFSFTSYRYMRQDGSKTNKVARAPKKIDYEGLLRNTIIGCSTVVIDKEIVGEFSMPLVRRGQDTATWLQLLKKEKYAYGIQEDLVNYRLVGNSISSNKIKALKRTWNTYRNVENLSLPKSLYVFCFYVFNAIKKRV